MPSRVINLIVIHCAATANGVALARNGLTAAQVIDRWHGAPVRDKAGRIVREHMFERTPIWRLHTRGHLFHLGYHDVIDVDGTRERGRDDDELGAHVNGHNRNSLGICMAGTDKFTLEQWATLRNVVQERLKKYPGARVCGHRDLSPDTDGDGTVERHEWLKICPGFDVTTWWLLRNFEPLSGHIVGERPR